MQIYHFICVSVLLVILDLTSQSLFVAVMCMGSCDAMRDDLGRDFFSLNVASECKGGIICSLSHIIHLPNKKPALAV